jgi:hypothetical protein
MAEAGCQALLQVSAQPPRDGVTADDGRGVSGRGTPASSRRLGIMSANSDMRFFLAEAAQARRLASTFLDPETVGDLEAFASELEEHARGLAREEDYRSNGH